MPPVTMANRAALIIPALDEEAAFFERFLVDGLNPLRHGQTGSHVNTSDERSSA